MSLTDKELYTKNVIDAYRRLMDLAFWDAAADDDEDSEPEKEEDK